MTPRRHTALGPGGEFDLVQAVWTRLGRVMGESGDDCAFVSIGKTTLAISNDLSLENVHFQAGWLAPDEIGYRATMAALSDLAAVAATPIGVQAGVGSSPELHHDVVPDLMDGVARAARDVDAMVLGGDLVRSDRLVVDVTVIGRLDGTPLRRTGASAGDELFVTGRLGGPLRALQAWTSRVEPPAWARDRFARPQARVREAQWLLGHGARSMIDLSDGLLADATHIAAANGVEAIIDLESVPCLESTRPRDAVRSGEEYELLVVFPPGSSPDLAMDFERTFATPLTRVGALASGSGVQICEHGHPVTHPEPFRHFG